MGNCGGTSQQNRKKDKLPQLKSEILTRQDQIARQMDQSVLFKVVLENIKIKNLPVTDTNLVISMGDIIVELPEISKTNSPHWKIKKETIIELQTTDLNKKQFQLQVISKGQEIAIIKLPVIKIVTGPVHHDLILNIQNQPDARITFLLTIAQQIEMTLTAREVTLELNEQGLKYERLKKPMPIAYNFNIKVKSHHKGYESNHSYNFLNKYNTKGQYQSYQSIKSQQHLHADQDAFFSDSYNDLDNNNNNQSHNIHGNVNLSRQASQNYLNNTINNNNNNIMNKNSSMHKIIEEEKPLSDDEFALDDIQETAAKVKIPGQKSETGTFDKITNTINTMKIMKEKKGQIYRINSQRLSINPIQNPLILHKQNSQITQMHNQNYGLNQSMGLQNQLSAKKLSITGNLLPNGMPLNQNSNYLITSQNYINNMQNLNLQRQLSNTVIQTYDEYLDWFKIQTWNFKDIGIGENTPKVQVKIFADEFSSSTFYLKVWANYETSLDPFQQPKKILNNNGNNNSSLAQQQSSTQNTSQQQKSQSSKVLKLTNSTSAAPQLLNANSNGGAVPILKKNRSQSNFYGNNNEDSDSSQESQSSVAVDEELVSHAEISMNKFCSENLDDQLSFITDQDKKILIQIHNLKDLKLYHHGKNVGSCSGNFTSHHVPFFRQMYGGVRTESGITKATQIYLQKKHLNDKSNKIPTEFRQIINKQDFIEEQMEKLGDDSLGYRQRMRINQDIKQNLVKINDILQIHSTQDHGQLFKSEEQLIDVQEILINLAKHLLTYADQVDEILRDQYFDCLIKIVNREEFDLSHMGFEHDFHNHFTKENQQIDLRKLKRHNKDNMDLIYKKIGVGLNYQKFLYNTLEKVLDKLELQGLNSKEQQFVENFCSLVYFRIPQFRDHLLDAISHKHSNTKLAEWVDINEEEQKNDVKLKLFLSMFSWEQDFYAYLKTQPRYEAHLDQLNRILEKTAWKHRFQKCGVAFFLFLQSWSQYVQKVIQVKHFNMPWEVLPGYNTLMKSFLWELKNRDTEQFPDSLKDASNMLLYCNNHLKPFLYVIYNKSNVNISRQVYYCYDMLNQWFQRINQMHLKIPTNFDFNFFFKGLNIVFNPAINEHNISIAKAMLVLYNNYQLFPVDKRIQEVNKIFFNQQKTFYFFTHWSRTVRNIFFQILMFRIYHYHRVLSLTENKKEDQQKEQNFFNLQRRKKSRFEDLNDPDIINPLVLEKYFEVIKQAKRSRKMIVQYLQTKDIPIQKQLQNNSLRVKLLTLKKKLQKHKLNMQRIKEQQQFSNSPNDTPTNKRSSNSIMTPEKGLQSPERFKTPSSVSITGKYDEIQNNTFSSSFVLQDDKNDQSIQSYCLPNRGLARDISDISQFKNYNSATPSESDISDDEQYLQNIKEDLKEEYGIQFEKSTKKYSRHNQKMAKKSSISPRNNNNIEKKNGFKTNNLIRQYQDSSPTYVQNDQRDQKSGSQELVRKFSFENQKGKSTIKEKTNQASLNNNKKNVQLKIVPKKKQAIKKEGKYILPKKSYKILITAVEEFEAVQKDYEKWYLMQQQQVLSTCNKTLNQMSKAEIQEKLNDLREAQVPDIPIRIHKDESESKNMFQADNEW